MMVSCTVNINCRKSCYHVNQQNRFPLEAAVYWEKIEYVINLIILGRESHNLRILLARELQLQRAGTPLNASKMSFRNVEW